MVNLPDFKFPRPGVTFHVGHLVVINFIKYHPDREYGQYEVEFVSHLSSGDGTLCLDFGQNWFITKGEKFFTGEAQLKAAAEYLSKYHEEIKKCPK